MPNGPATWPELRITVREDALRYADGAVSLLEADLESGNFGDDEAELRRDMSTIADLLDGLMILGCTPGQVLGPCERTRTTLSEWPIEADLRNAVVRDFLGRIDSSRRTLRLAAVSAEELDVSRELQVARECLLVLNRSRRPDLALAFRVTAEIRRLAERQEELRRERIALEDGRLRSETRAVARADSPVRVVYDVDAGEDIVEGSDA